MFPSCQQKLVSELIMVTPNYKADIKHEILGLQKLFKPQFYVFKSVSLNNLKLKLKYFIYQGKVNLTLSFHIFPLYTAALHFNRITKTFIKNL